MLFCCRYPQLTLGVIDILSFQDITKCTSFGTSATITARLVAGRIVPSHNAPPCHTLHYAGIAVHAGFYASFLLQKAMILSE